jgi:hypothetical protein
MKFQIRLRRPLVMSWITLPLLFIAVAIGCNEQGGGRGHEPNLRHAYNQYLAAHAGNAPRDADEFMAYPVRDRCSGMACLGWMSCSSRRVISSH